MVRYYNDDCTYRLPEKRLTAAWLKRVAEEEGYTLGDVTYIFCSSAVHRKMNVDFIGHDYFTDVITFEERDGRVEEGVVSGEVYIDVATVEDNAPKYNALPINEMRRVIVHGALHLCGHKDKTAWAEKNMRRMENKYLKLLREKYL